ncbi:MAG: polysaccharide biosynthesis C-terminal domain-containing protein [Tannerella sp.]|jgi:O-antigen/teichoic acid export membrane protein|nr:polysaccharide biosynthesis C-terminal domain-containing protein [Tannerella sp.]
MWKKVLATIATRYLVAFLNLLLIIINAKVLGKSGMGLIGVIYASANIALIFNSVLCGSTIVYYMTRYHYRFVVWPAYVWAFVGSAVACGLMSCFGLLPEHYGMAIYGLSVLQSLVVVHSRVLLGGGHIRSFNVTFMLQGGLLFFVLLYVYYVAGRRDASGYLLGLFLTQGVAWAVSLALLVSLLRRKRTEDRRPAPASTVKMLREMFVYGLWGCADNLAEGLTARINYFLIQRLGGYGQVGLLDAGTKIAESVWHISRSISFISYSEVARATDAQAQRQMTLHFLKWTFCVMLAAMLAVWFLPEWIYTDYLFTAEFLGVRRVIRGLAVGIVALGCNSILSHHFIGTGKVKYSTACSCIGLLVLLVAGYFLIPVYGVYGAAVSTSIAFTSMLTFSLIIFIAKK